MTRTHIPSSFEPVPHPAPLFQLSNPKGHRFSIQPIANIPGVVRVVHQLPSSFPQKQNGEIKWEEVEEGANATVSTRFLVGIWLIRALCYAQIEGTKAVINTDTLTILVDFEECPRIEWLTQNQTPILADSHTRAYAFNAATGAVNHYVRTVLTPLYGRS